LRDAYVASIDTIGMGDLVGIVGAFKRLGRPELATEMIGTFVESRKDVPGALDPEAGHFGPLIDDPEILEAFQAAAPPASFPARVLENLAGPSENWPPDVIEALAAATVEEFRLAFKSRSGPALRKMLANAMRFANVVNSTTAMRRVTENAKAALRAIAKESPINAFRVARLGVAPDAVREDPDGK
jgi:hypothetical protein